MSFHPNIPRKAATADEQIDPPPQMLVDDILDARLQAIAENSSFKSN